MTDDPFPPQPLPIRLLVIVVLVGFLAGVASSAWAQPATPSSRLAWDQDDADASTLAYFVSVDGAAATEVQAVTCQPAGPGTLPAHVCEGDLPPLETGERVLVLVSRRIIEGVAFDSLPSDPLTITFAALPSTPTGLRLVDPDE